MKAITIDTGAARRFLMDCQGIVNPFADVATALQQLAYVQMDPINVCGRMHDLILRNRVLDYRENDLLRHTYIEAGDRESRQAFEHYLPGPGILVTLPVDAWPMLKPHMAQRAERRRGYAGRLSAAEERLADQILGELRRRGPLSSDDIEHQGRAQTDWGSPGRAVKIVLDKLFAHGRVLIAARRGFRRVYDLPQRVMPRRILRRKTADISDSGRWQLHMRLRQHRLLRLSRQKLALVEDLVQALTVKDCPPLYCLRSDVPKIDVANSMPRLSISPRLLAPLDPLIYDRQLTSKLWGFDYTWEVYTPAAKRRRGYYALPLLSEQALVGHVDPRADRQLGRLEIMSKQVRRGHRYAPATRQLAEFLELSN